MKSLCHISLTRVGTATLCVADVLADGECGFDSACEGVTGIESC